VKGYGRIDENAPWKCLVSPEEQSTHLLIAL